MKDFMKRMKISYLLAAVLYVALGVVLLFWTGTTLAVLCYTFGGVMLAYGIMTIISFFVHDSAAGSFRLELLLGVFTSALGILFLIQPDFILSIVPVILGVYIIIDSLVNLKRGIDLFRLEYPRWWVTLALSLLGAALGVVILRNPFTTQLLLFRVIGMVFAYLGLSDLWALFKVSRLTKDLHKRSHIQVDPIDIE